MHINGMSVKKRRLKEKYFKSCESNEEKSNEEKNPHEKLKAGPKPMFFNFKHFNALKLDYFNFTLSFILLIMLKRICAQSFMSHPGWAKVHYNGH